MCIPHEDLPDQSVNKQNGHRSFECRCDAGVSWKILSTNEMLQEWCAVLQRGVSQLGWGTYRHDNRFEEGCGSCRDGPLDEGDGSILMQRDDVGCSRQGQGPNLQRMWAHMRSTLNPLHPLQCWVSID